MLRNLYLQSIVLFYTTLILGQARKQPNIQFETNYIDAVDHWVVLPQKTTDLNYLLGYVYLDDIVGFTFTLYGELLVDSFSDWKLQEKLEYEHCQEPTRFKNTSDSPVDQ